MTTSIADCLQSLLKIWRSREPTFGLEHMRTCRATLESTSSSLDTVFIPVKRLMNLASGEDVVDDVGPFDAGQFRVEPLELDAEGVVPDAELMQHRRVQVMDRANLFGRGVTELVGRPVNDPAADPATR
jgi:hypothetical protein